MKRKSCTVNDAYSGSSSNKILDSKKRKEQQIIVDLTETNPHQFNLTIDSDTGIIDDLQLNIKTNKIVKQKSITSFFQRKVITELQSVNQNIDYNTKIIEAPIPEWFYMKTATLSKEDLSLIKGNTFYKKGNKENSIVNFTKDQFETNIKSPDKLLSLSLQINFNIKENKPTCKLLSLTNQMSKKSNIITIQNKNIYLSLSFIKSLLQKTVRLGYVSSAVKISKIFIYQFSWIEFLRRLQVIIVEDAILHPLFHLINYWMLYYTKRDEKSVPLQFIEISLQIVADITNCKLRELLSFGDEIESVDNLFTNTNKQLSECELCLIRSLLIRSYFGGLKGDVKLLQNQATLWYLRFTNKIDLPNSLDISNLEFDRLEIPKYFKNLLNEKVFNEGSYWFKYLLYVYYGKDSSFRNCEEEYQKYRNGINLNEIATHFVCDDIVLSSIDFHCFPELVNYCVEYLQQSLQTINQELYRYFEKITLEEKEAIIRGIVWHKRSKLNVRDLMATKKIISTDTDSTSDEDISKVDWKDIEWDNCLNLNQKAIWKVLSDEMNRLYVKTLQTK
ncbi:hypothetical protein ABK040_012852 [Willaertia magna]